MAKINLTTNEITNTVTKEKSFMAILRDNYGSVTAKYSDEAVMMEETKPEKVIQFIKEYADSQDAEDIAMSVMEHGISINGKYYDGEEITEIQETTLPDEE